MTSMDVISRLREELKVLTGPARAQPLTHLAQALVAQYTEVQGRPEGLPFVNDAVTALDEAYGYLGLGDPIRGQVAGMLGWLLGIRYLAYGNAERDRQTGIHVLEEACAFPTLPGMLGSIVRIVLGQLYLTRITEVLGSFGFGMPTVSADRWQAATDDLDRAAVCFREALAENISPQVAELVQAMLEMTEVARDVVEGMRAGPMGVDLNRMMTVVGRMQRLQELANRFGAGAPGTAGSSMLSVLDPAKLATIDPWDRQAVPAPDAVPRQVGAPVEPAPVDHERLRHALREQMAGAVEGVTGEIWTLGAALLFPATPLPTQDTVDDLVALASSLVEDAPDGGVDDFLFAVTLQLRYRAGGGAEEDDRLAGAASLLAAVRALGPDHPATVTICATLGAFLVGGGADADLFGAVGEEFADRVDAVIASGSVRDGADLVVLHALRSLCRAASGGEDAAQVRRAIGTVPTDYPWLGSLRTAAEAITGGYSLDGG